jgi:hypothetical protein
LEVAQRLMGSEARMIGSETDWLEVKQEGWEVKHGCLEVAPQLMGT